MIRAIHGWLTDLWTTLTDNFHPIWDSLDILVVTVAVYWLLLRIRGTRAAQMTLGLLILVFVWRLADLFELATVSFLLDKFLSSGLLILIVIFQHDIRRALSRVGRGLFSPSRREDAHSIEEIVRACQVLAQRRIGALIVMERDIELDEFTQAGTKIDSELTRDLLVSIFLPYSPIHDGAVVIRRNRIASAGCILPLAIRTDIPSSLGTRHRAAFGITEETDAVVVVVSEETGKVSLVVGGEIHPDLDAPRLRQLLLHLSGDARLEVAESIAETPPREEPPARSSRAVGS